MKKITVAIILYFFLSVNSFSHLNHYAEVKYLEYDLYRNNDLIGSHIYIFDRKGDILSVKSTVNFKITKLGIDLYKYFAESNEIYNKNIFTSFNSTTLQNKKNKYVNINLDTKKDKLYIDGSSFKGETGPDNVIGNWWNAKILKSESQISPLSGSVKEQIVKLVGKDEMILNGKKYKLFKFNLKSSNEEMPKDESVEDIFLDIMPDFPTPEKITLPLQFKIRSTALIKELLKTLLIFFSSCICICAAFFGKDK